MVERAGIKPSPSAVTSVVPMSSGAGDMAALYEGLGKVAGDIRNKLQPALNQHEEIAGAKAAEQGNYRQRIVLGAEDAYYNHAVEAGYLSKTGNEIDMRALQIEGDFPLDGNLEDLSKSFDEARSAYLAGTPGDYAQAVAGAWDKVKGEAMQRVALQQRQHALAGSEKSIKTRMAFIEDRLSGAYDATDPGVVALMDEYKTLAKTMSDNPLFDYPAAQAEADQQRLVAGVTGRAIAHAGVGMYEDLVKAGTDGKVAAAQANQYLQDQLKRLDLPLSSAQRDNIIGSGMREIRAMEAERRAGEAGTNAALSEARKEARAEISDYQGAWSDAIKRGIKAPADSLNELEDSVAAYGTPAQRVEMAHIRALNDAVTHLDSMTVAEMDASLGEMAARASSDIGVAAIYDDYRQAVANRISAIKVHPGTVYARTHGEEMPPVNWSNPETGQLRMYFDYQDKAAAAFGAPAQYLSPAQRAAVNAISDNGGEVAIAWAAQVAAAAGPSRASKIFSEAADMDATALGYAGGLAAGGGDPEISRAIMMGASARKTPSALKMDLDADDRQSIFNAEARPFLKGASPRSLKDVADAAELAFEGMAQARGPGSKGNQRALYTKALNGVLGQLGSFGGQAQGMRGGNGVIVPTWIKRDQFANLMRSMTSADWRKASGGGYPAIRTWDGKLEGPSVGELRGAYLIPQGDGRFALSSVSPDGGSVRLYRTPSGKPFVIDLARLRPQWKRTRPDAVR